MVAFCEARKISSTDKTPTDIVMKRSTDNGKTWSEMQVLIHGDKEAFMDPVEILAEGHLLNGFGPGSCIQMKGAAFKTDLLFQHGNLMLKKDLFATELYTVMITE
ncbi:MAG: sialidase family protein [Fermentimonas sp.]|nr:sialidase family protein [Fermentimonas sp.]